VFALDDRSMQVVWGDAPPGPVHVVVESVGSSRGGTGRVRHGGYLPGGGGPGGLVVDGLGPATTYRVTVTAGGAPGSGGASAAWAGRRRTLAPPPGELLCRVATVSDVPLGANRFGLLPRLRDRSGLAEPPPLRCARHALAEASAWSPDLLVVKGDLTDHGWHQEWSLAQRLLTEVRVPVVVATGNHEWSQRREVVAPAPLQDAELTWPEPLHVVDLPGLRVVTVDSSRDSDTRGTFANALPDLLDALAESDRPALVCLHHALDRWPVATKYPAGVPWREAQGALEAIARVKRDVLITAGHTHRNRRRQAGPLVVTEVASTKDYPGVWAGYAAYEGGIVQTVRRTLHPAALGWTEQTRRAVAGVWGHYAPGRLADRCFSHVWPC
jgi:3',5'-cyclic AMP phosphodiesterase CpdA